MVWVIGCYKKTANEICWRFFFKDGYGWVYFFFDLFFLLYFSACFFFFLRLAALSFWTIGSEFPLRCVFFTAECWPGFASSSSLLSESFGFGECLAAYFFFAGFFFVAFFLLLLSTF